MVDRIVVSSQPPGGLDALVDPRFGRCAVFTVCEIENNAIKEVTTQNNPAMQAFGGAGIQAASWLVTWVLKPC